MQWPSISWPRRWRNNPRRAGAGCAAFAASLALILAGCSSTPDREADPDRPLGDAAYDSYPDPADVPQDLALIPEPEPRDEPPSRYGNPPEYEVFGQRYRTLRTSDGFEEEGYASWYGTKFHGRRTSSGEPYDMYAMTAAHKSLPLPSYVEVTNLDNDKRVVVRVNDRGPFVDGRIIDLSYAAAHRIDMTDAGVARVRIRSVGPGDTAPARVAEAPEPAPLEVAAAPRPEAAAEPQDAAPAAARSNGEAAGPGRFVQVGAFAERHSAEQVREDLRALGFEPVRISSVERDNGAELHRVRIGPLPDGDAVRSITDRLQGAAHVDYRVVNDAP
ncbi:MULTISPECIES: septal ring lytic transglycosylase RlpA family protein [unclassified Thioalkalivibrio]|uniref:septal ring lytic transglycosylase RlpA family protein n=1 Tax=unclassified Thioalkalivibrio TaxID=2621013 RepID=UPI000362AFBF|nr:MULTISPECIES: septal ring lytic transglycosylase RlpA family protein [unclassified Thioalkalivibrio]